MCVLSQLLTIGFLFATEARSDLPEKIVYLYNQPLNTEDVTGIMQKISAGESTDTIYNGPTKVMKSAWVYIPGEILRKDTSRNYILTGYYEAMDLYEHINGHWKKVFRGGAYMKFSEEKSGKAGRFFFKLFDPGEKIADAYLVACRRYDDYVYSQMEGIPMSEAEIKGWKHQYDQSKEWFNRMTLPFWGILMLTTIVLGARYVSSRDKAYLMYTIGNLFFVINCILLYFIDPANIQYYPFDDPMLAVAVTGPVFILGVGGFILSFRYFYTQGPFLELARMITFWAALSCLLVAAFNTVVNYYWRTLFITNIVMYLFLVLMIVVIYMIIFRNRDSMKGLTMTTSFLTIIYGSFFIALASVAGFILSAVFAQNTLYLGKFHLQSFPLLIGIAIYNAFVLMAFSSRDHQIAEEANQLKIKAYEYEVRVLQNSLNPHFIFNSLNLIDFFVYRKDLPRARNALFQFSDLLRMVIDKTGEKMISLDEELKMLELYLKLESSRNKELFTYEILVDKDVETGKILIPPLLIQPIVENALKHGILNKEDGGGQISIILSVDRDFLKIEVRDNGIGFKKSAELKSFIHNDRKHLGMELTRRRLELMSEQSRIEIRDLPEGEGASVVIKIPVK